MRHNSGVPSFNQKLRSVGRGLYVGGCQNYGFLVPYYNTAPNI